MNKKILILAVGIALAGILFYTFKGTSPITEGYVEKIETARAETNDFLKNAEDSPLTDSQKAAFTTLNYFPIAEKYRVKSDFQLSQRQQIIQMGISDGSQKAYLVFGHAHLHLEGKELNLTVYKPLQDDADYLFIPFYDHTSAELTYGGGRYVEPELADDGALIIDFNLAYNPYCAYNPSYKCPIPPPENRLDVSVLAGEKNPDFVK
ncbi:MAG: DUF1684 domain-containing protein [Cyclobacteriaceae bacterium]|nr:DUF1684 domain-containing protein [Cyclobacteriaceae bacterium]